MRTTMWAVVIHSGCVAWFLLGSYFLLQLYLHVVQPVSIPKLEVPVLESVCYKLVCNGR